MLYFKCENCKIIILEIATPSFKNLELLVSYFIVLKL